MHEKDTNSQAGFLEIVEMLLRRRTLFIVPWAGVFIFSIIAGFLAPKTYETSALIQVRSKEIIDPLMRGIVVSPDELRVAIETLSKQILAWPKLEQLVIQLHLADNVKSLTKRENFIKKLKERIQIKVRNNDVIEIIYQDRNPVSAQQVVNTITQNFIDGNAMLKREEARNAIDFISEQLSVYRNKLEKSEENFSINKIDSDLRLAVNRRTILQDRMANLQKIIPSQITTEQNPIVSQMQQRLGQLETELARLMLDAREGNPRVEALKKEVENIKERIGAEMEKKTVKESISTYNPLYLQSEQELKTVEMEIGYLENRKAILQRSEKKLGKQISESELANLERNKRVDEDIYQILLRQLESAYVSERLQDSEKGNRFTVIEYARLPLTPAKPNRNKIAALGFFGGMALGFGLVFLAENLNKSFQTADQVKESLNLPSLGSISKIILEQDIKKSPFAEIKQGIDKYIQRNPTLSKMRFVSPHIAKKVLNTGILPQVVMYHEPRCKVSEEFRVLRTNMYQGTDIGPNLKTILITSTLRSEGKSITSANLAIAVADSGKNTLLVDCDLRKGTINELFSLSAAHGIGEVLCGTREINTAIVKSPISNLSILPCGTVYEKPAELLGSVNMAKLMDILKARFDAIILDAPPVLHLPDACILSKYSDGIVFVVQSGRARCADVTAAQSALKQVNAKVAGFVMTSVQYYIPKYLYDYYYES